MNLQEMRKDITRLIDDIKYHSDSLTSHHQLPILQLNIILAKMNKMVEKTIILKHHLEMNAEEMKYTEDMEEPDPDPEPEPDDEPEAETGSTTVISETTVEKVKVTEESKKKEAKKDIAQKLKSTHIPDLKTAIGIYERYLFANELFNGSIEAYDEAIQALNEFDDLEKANYYLHEGLVKEFNWDLENEFVCSFCELVQRRYEKS